MLGFDRILAYSSFGEGVIRRSIGDEAAAVKGLTYRPHGIDGEMFFQMDRAASRKALLSKTLVRIARNGSEASTYRGRRSSDRHRCDESGAQELGSRHRDLRNAEGERAQSSPMDSHQQA